MKRLLLTVVLSGVVSVAAAQVAVEQPVAPVANVAAASTDTPVVDTATASIETPVAKGKDRIALKDKATDSRCIQQTGSRIAARNQAGKCNGEPGTSYTPDDLLGTGRVGIGDALRALNTSIR
jgi:hypothetical protein